MRYIIGIDEVGRGSLAGPVAVAAVCIPEKLRIENRKLGKLRDSKKLTAKQRRSWLEYFKNHSQVEYAVARVYPRAIEKINISQAANLAAMRAHTRLWKIAKLPGLRSRSRFGGISKIENCRIFLDGGLFLGNKTKNIRVYSRNDPRLSARTIVRGDEKIKAVAAASIVAKVYRDRAMVWLAKKHPQYGFEIHKGYGTRSHLRAIKKYGASEAHRKSFDPIKKMLYNKANQ